MFRRLSRERFLSDQELARFMDAVRSRRHKNQPRDHALFALLANTGMRPSEVLELKRSHVHLSSSPAWIRVHRLKKKRLAFDDIEIAESLASVVRGHADSVTGEDDKLFPITRRQAQRLFHFYTRQVGIPKSRRMYVLRHTAATRIYRHTRDIKIVQSLLGHEKPETSSIYAHVCRHMLRSTNGSLPTTEEEHG